MMSWKVIFFALILLSSVSVIPLTFAQVAPVAIFQSPKKQTEQGASLEQVKCNDDLVLVKKLSDNSPACVKLQTAKKLAERGWGTLPAVSMGPPTIIPNSITGIMNVTNTKLSVNYTITNAKILNIIDDIQSKSLDITIQTSGEGNLILTIPRAIVDAKISDQTDDQFFVLADGYEINYKEIKKTSIDRTLSIPFKDGVSKIEIIGIWLN